MINSQTRDAYANTGTAPAAVAGWDEGAVAELTRARDELEQERERRHRAEADAAMAQERAASAEWLVAVLRSELTGSERPRRWRWPWQKRWEW